MNKNELIRELIKDGYLKSPAIIDAFKSIDRKNFVPKELQRETYLNQPLSIGFGQTISQPLTVAFMLELLDPQPGEKILDVGAGSGWQTALLAYIVGNPPTGGGKVVAIERIKELAQMAKKNISKYNFVDKKIVELVHGDGSEGYMPEAPYDAIIAAASTHEIPQPWKNQLKIGGKIIAPVEHSIIVINKIGENKFETKEYFGFSFVPLLKGKKEY